MFSQLSFYIKLIKNKVKTRIRIKKKELNCRNVFKKRQNMQQEEEKKLKYVYNVFENYIEK